MRVRLSVGSFHFTSRLLRQASMQESVQNGVEKYLYVICVEPTYSTAVLAAYMLELFFGRRYDIYICVPCTSYTSYYVLQMSTLLPYLVPKSNGKVKCDTHQHVLIIFFGRSRSTALSRK